MQKVQARGRYNQLF